MITKKDLRIHYLKLRDSLEELYIKDYSNKIVSLIKNDPSFKKAKNIGIYHPIRGEIDLTGLLENTSNKKFYLPKVEGENIIFIEYNKNTKLAKNKYGILEPVSGKDTKLDLIFVPALLYNENNYRIGYGAGYYDRYLKDKNIIKIGISYLFSFFNFKEDPYDIKLDYVISLKEYYKRNLVILAGGLGDRLGITKGTYNVLEKPIFEYALRNFDNSFYKIIVLPEKEFLNISKNPNCTYLIGGTTRTNSMLNSILFLSNSNYTYIHDGARVYVSKELIDNLVKEELKLYDIYYPYHLETNAIRNLNEDLIDNKELKIVETPQVIKTKLLKELNIDKITKSYRDDIDLIKDNYKNIKLGSILNNTFNHKITYQNDLLNFETSFNRKFLIGHSFDIHTLKKDRKLYLGGILIRDDYGLLAHSDGDVLLHAVTESILGALGLGDLGYNFPPSDDKFKNISSHFFLEKAKTFLKEKKYSIINIDILLYYDGMNLNKFFPKIKENLINILNTPNISLKATTTEKVGVIKNNAAIGCEAVVLLGDISDNRN